MSTDLSKYEKKLQAISAEFAHLYVARKSERTPLKEFKLIKEEPGAGMSTMTEILTAHQRHNLRSCLCGWDALGKSHPQHQEAMLTAAGFGELREAKAQALEEAANDFEDNVGVGEFDEQARRDGRRWIHIEEAWEHQGAYMDWLRARAAAVRGEG